MKNDIVILALLLSTTTIGLCYSKPISFSNYIKTGECHAAEVCVYSYLVDQQFGRNAEQNLTFLATVDIACHSVGTYNGSFATQYCMTVTDAKVDGIVFNDRTNQTKMKQDELIGQLLSRWFCFVQTDDGKVASVQHASDEKESAVDLKKSIAAAFQANFRGTEEEIESDPQSDHIAHYRHEQSSHNIKKMHRHIEGDDVIDYSSGAKKKSINLLKDEDIEYRDGFLYHSAGRTALKIKGQSQDAVENSVSEAFAAEGSYSLELQQCFVPTKRTQNRRRRSVNEEMEKDLTEEDLKAYYDKSLHARERMLFIRENIPSVPAALTELHKDPSNFKLFDLLEHLLEMEYQYGTQPEYSPALEDVLNYLQKIHYSEQPRDMKMRETIYALLSMEGSLRSQMVLLEALQSSVSDQEREIVIMELSMIRNAHIEFVTALQEEFLTASQYFPEKDSLLLSFGVLASRAQPDVELAIANFLIQQETSIALNDSSALVHLLLAMGNTGSIHVVATILGYVDHQSRDVQAASIRALVKFTYLQQVQDRIQGVLQNQLDEETIIMISQTLIKGQLYAERTDIEVEVDSSHTMLPTLVAAVLNTNNTDLMNRVSTYISKVGGEQTVELLEQLHIRLGRGTDWDAHSSDYDCVATQSSRASDVSTYQKHKAYIFGQKLGNNDINMKIGAGVFMGISNDCNSMKGFARACARAKVFGETRDLAEIEFKVEKSEATISGRAYAQIGGNTLLNYQRWVDATYCLSYERSLYERRQRIFQFSYSIWIYAGYVDASISLYLSLNNNFDAEMCASINTNELLSATTGIVPRISLTLDGSASYTFIEVARVGFSAEADFTYQIEPRGTGKACAVECSSGDYQTCAGVYDSWPGNEISLYAWYQTREIEWCSTWWISYPCGFDWGSRNRWDALSWSWSLGSGSRRALIEACYPKSSSCPASPL